ncbi:hypothetical protein D9613_010316 [Agrocybe pediades]|uniref:Protein kinase domain-containing protein n=1 Tax=Agrocybe pediades TaxID=84607 RepID=A0A8H4QFT8_9AGAR|nr:hypothetical protein D9613_010316 [Agrocybe pediades]
MGTNLLRDVGVLLVWLLFQKYTYTHTHIDSSILAHGHLLVANSGGPMHNFQLIWLRLCDSDFENATVYFSERGKASTGLPPFFWGYLLHSPCTFLGSHRTDLAETGVLEKKTSVNLYLSKANLIRHIGTEGGDDMLFVTGVTSDHQCTVFWDGHSANSVRLKDASGGMTYVGGVQIQKGLSRPLRNGNIISFVTRAEGNTSSPGLISRDYVYFHVPTKLPVDVRSMYVLGRDNLGAGQTAVVREGIHKSSGARYAIKSYRMDSENTGRIKRHIAKEIRAAASFNHPGICQLLEIFAATNGRITDAVFEYFDGTDLNTYLKRFPRLSTDLSDITYELRSFVKAESTTQHISFQMCCALSHIHSFNIVHGDIKPANILISRHVCYPIVKICDFGTAQLATLPRPEYIGSLAYSSPEAIYPNIFNSYTTVADSWSLGAVIFLMLTKEPAYLDSDVNVIGDRRSSVPIRWNNLEAVGVGIHCKDILARMLQVNPTQRISVYEALNHPWLSLRQHVLAETKTQPTPAVPAALQNVLTERWSPSPSDTPFTTTLPDVVVSPVPIMVSSSSTLRSSPEKALRRSQTTRKGHAKCCTLHCGKMSNPPKAVACLECRKKKARVGKPKLLTRGQVLAAKKKLQMKLRKA